MSDIPEVKELTVEEGRELFDDAAWRMFGISGEEFLERYVGGYYDGFVDAEKHRELTTMEMLLPFVR